MQRLNDAWKTFWAWRWRVKGPVIAVAALLVLTIVGAALGGEDEEGPAAADPGESSQTPAGDQSPQATHTNEPTETPEPTATSTPVPTATPLPGPFALNGSGLGVTDTVNLATGVWIASIQSPPNGYFGVTTYIDGESTLLVNAIAPYAGSRPIFASGSDVFFEVDADGPWAIALTFNSGVLLDPAFSGVGDAVSGFFVPEGSPIPMSISNDGPSNFIVWLHCDVGSDLFVNEIGSIAGSQVLEIPEDSSICLWEVESQGTWALAPQ